MYRRPIVIGNWKMYTTAAEAVTLASRIRTVAEAVDDIDIVVLPPVIWLPTLVEALHHRPRTLAFGLQNFYPKPDGPYTGEISPAMAAGLATYALVGHSERRAIFGETDELVNEKLAAALDAGLHPILCVGELTKVALEKRGRGRPTVLQRQSNIFRQLDRALEGITSPQVERLVVCYEPLWAIGSGRPVPGGHVEAILVALREILIRRFGAAVAERIRTIYGGSSTPDNADDYLGQRHIDGLLVGGASLDASQFAEIIRAGARRVHREELA